MGKYLLLALLTGCATYNECADTNYRTCRRMYHYMNNTFQDKTSELSIEFRCRKFAREYKD